jgi:hypothetical protein
MGVAAPLFGSSHYVEVYPAVYKVALTNERGG